MINNILVLIAVIAIFLTIGSASTGNTIEGFSSDKDSAIEIEMVYVKGGCYQMGDTFDDVDYGYFPNDDEVPVHEVCVDDFYIGKYEVTLGLWKSIMGNTNTRAYMEHCKDNCPMGEISWNEAQEFIRRLNSKSSGSKYRLPTEAEWEYACRSGGKKERYCGGDDLNAVAWYDGNSRNADGKTPTRPVGTKQPNGLGIYDMQGNVWEWTNDWYAADYYSKSPRNNPAGPDSGQARSLRGACVSGGGQGMRASRRNAYTPDTRNDHVGFRLVKTP